MKSNQKHPRCILKKEQPRTKTGLAKKVMKSNGWLRPPGFHRVESFGRDDLTANIVISGAQGLLMLMGAKFLIKMTRPQNTVGGIGCPFHFTSFSARPV